jgi:hypothetical protein
VAHEGMFGIICVFQVEQNENWLKNFILIEEEKVKKRGRKKLNGGNFKV